jgi:hypothetical protein
MVAGPRQHNLNDHFKSAANCYHFKTGQGKVPELKCFTLSLAGQATFDCVMCNLGQL